MLSSLKSAPSTALGEAAGGLAAVLDADVSRFRSTLERDEAAWSTRG